jgi:tripartite-type tricarboxylate transporter receptor subunit TctC
MLAGGAGAQPANYPDRPVRIISDAAPGGAIDTNLRIIAEALGKKWAQQVVIGGYPAPLNLGTAHASEPRRWKA